MEQYRLNTLIFFLKVQKELGYYDINKMLDIIDDPVIPDAKKGDLIIKTLRNAGLNEVGYKDGDFDPVGEIHGTVESKHELNDTPIQEFLLHLVNGTMELYIIMN